MFKKDAFLNPGGFSWQRALNCALASQVAYQETAGVRDQGKRWGFEESEAFSENRTQGFIAWDADFVLVSFRGTKELGDWLTNLNTIRTENPPSYGKVHSGFFQAFNDARVRVSELLTRAKASEKSVWVTGHSLGGALSTIMAGDVLNRLPVSGIYTYGQPRVVNRRAQGMFRNYYHDKFFRIVNDDDIVPKVPPLLKHVGTTLWFDEDGSMKEAPPGVRSDEFGPEEMTEDQFEEELNKLKSLQKQINETQEAVAALEVDEIVAETSAAEVETRGLLPSVSDHMMDKYIQKIIAKVNAES